MSVSEAKEAVGKGREGVRHGLNIDVWFPWRIINIYLNILIYCIFSICYM